MPAFPVPFAACPSAPAARPLRRVAALALWAVSAIASQALAATCQLQWQLTPRLDTQPRSLEVRMAFDGGNRGRTSLRLPGGWDGVAEAPGTVGTLEPVAADGQLRQVRHQPGERVQLAWRLPLPDSTSPTGADPARPWFAFSGETALPWPEELAAQAQVPVCVELKAADSVATRWVSSFGRGEGPSAQWSLPAGAAQVQRALFAGGHLQWHEQRAGQQTLTVALPEASALPWDARGLAQHASQTLAALNRPWPHPDTAPLLLLALPSTGPALGVPLHQAMALQLPASLAVPGPGFDQLLAAPWHRALLQERLGPLAHLGRGDAPLRAWFTEGFADHLTHRWLLRHGQWSTNDYAAALNRKLARYQAQPEIEADNLRVMTGRAGPEALAELPAARGEWLALDWHQALRRAGQPGLDAVLHQLQLPASQARREGPLSAPLATHRLLAAMRRTLGDAALKDLTQHIDDGVRFSFAATSLGPCFQLRTDGTSAPTQYAAHDKALERSDCQAWLNGGRASATEGLGAAPVLASAAAAAAAADAARGNDADDAEPAPTRRTVCSPAKPAAKAGKKGAKGKPAAAPRQVCKTVTVPAPRAAASATASGARAGARAGTPAGKKAGKASAGKPAKAAKPAKASKAPKAAASPKAKADKKARG